MTGSSYFEVGEEMRRLLVILLESWPKQQQSQRESRRAFTFTAVGVCVCGGQTQAEE